MDKLIEITEPNEDCRLYEYGNLRACVSDVQYSKNFNYLHMAITCLSPKNLKRPDVNQINSIINLLFVRNNKPLEYLMKSPYTNEVIHLWEANEAGKKIVLNFDIIGV